MGCCELDYKIGVVGLYLCLMCGFVPYRSAASVTSVDDYVAALGVGERLHGAQNAAAGIRSVTGVYVHVE